MNVPRWRRCSTPQCNRRNEADLVRRLLASPESKTSTHSHSISSPWYAASRKCSKERWARRLLSEFRKKKSGARTCRRQSARTRDTQPHDQCPRCDAPRRIGTYRETNRTTGPDAPPELSPGDYVVMSISDDGIGMDEATLARAFEPFFTTKEVGAGSGLGLPMVQGFAVQSGGAIRILANPAMVPQLNCGCRALLNGRGRERGEMGESLGYVWGTLREEPDIDLLVVIIGEPRGGAIGRADHRARRHSRQR